jgi:hypothetical protein
MITLRVGNQNIISCWLDQLFCSTLVDNVKRIGGFEESHVAVKGVMRQVEIAPKYICCKFDDMTSEPIEAWQNFEDNIPILGEHEQLEAGTSKSED